MTIGKTRSKYLKQHIPQFGAKDNNELIECLLVLGISSFKSLVEGRIKTAKTLKILRKAASRICDDYEELNSEMNDLNTSQQTLEETNSEAETVTHHQSLNIAHSGLQSSSAVATNPNNLSFNSGSKKMIESFQNLQNMQSGSMNQSHLNMSTVSSKQQSMASSNAWMNAQSHNASEIHIDMKDIQPEFINQQIYSQHQQMEQAGLFENKMFKQMEPGVVSQSACKPKKKKNKNQRKQRKSAQSYKSNRSTSVKKRKPRRSTGLDFKPHTQTPQKKKISKRHANTGRRSRRSSLNHVQSRVDSGLHEIRAQRTSARKTRSSCRSFNSFHLPAKQTPKRQRCRSSQKQRRIGNLPRAPPTNLNYQERKKDQQKKLAQKQLELDEKRQIYESLKQQEMTQNGVVYHSGDTHRYEEMKNLEEDEQELPTREVNVDVQRKARRSESVNSRGSRNKPKIQSMKKMKQKLGKVQSKIKSRIAQDKLKHKAESMGLTVEQYEQLYASPSKNFQQSELTDSGFQGFNQQINFETEHSELEFKQEQQVKEDLQPEEIPPLNSLDKRIKSYYGHNENIQSAGNLKDIRDYVKARKIVDSIEKNNSIEPQVVNDAEYEPKIREVIMPNQIPGLEHTNSGNYLKETRSIEMSKIMNGVNRKIPTPSSNVLDKYQSKLSELDQRLQQSSSRIGSIQGQDQIQQNSPPLNENLNFAYGANSTERLMESSRRAANNPVSTTRSKSKYRIEIEKLQERIDAFEKEQDGGSGTKRTVDYDISDPMQTERLVGNNPAPKVERLNFQTQPGVNHASKGSLDNYNYEYTTTEFSTERSGLKYRPGFGGQEDMTSRTMSQFSAFEPNEEMKSKFQTILRYLGQFLSRLNMF